MALTKCPECSREVSDKAAACPSCAFPIAKPGWHTADETVELTSKKWKGAQLLSVVLIGGGVVAIMTATDSDASGAPVGFGSAAIMLGIVLYAVARIMIWWHHK